MAACLFAMAGYSSGSPQSYTLSEAIAKKMIKVTIKGGNYETGSSSYYGKCISMTIKNLTQGALNLTLENGRKLKCTYDSVQDMLVTKSEVFALGGLSEHEYKVYAMCSQKHDRCPSTTSVFNLSEVANGYLLQLTQLIEKLNAHDRTGQSAVWVLTDGDDPNNVTGSDTMVVRSLKGLLAKARATVKRDEKFIYDYSFPQVTNGAFKIEGDFVWQMQYAGKVSLWIYDNSGNKLSSIFLNKYYDRGTQTFHYSVQDPEFRPGEMYWIRLMADRTKLKEVAVTMDP